MCGERCNACMFGLPLASAGVPHSSVQHETVHPRVISPRGADGMRRVRCDRGWGSVVAAGDGSMLLERLDPSAVARVKRHASP